MAETFMQAATSIGFEVALSSLAKLIGGPIAVAYSAYELYENYSGLRTVIGALADRFPEITALQDLEKALVKVEALLESFGLDGDKLSTSEREAIAEAVEEETGLTIDKDASLEQLEGGFWSNLMNIDNCFPFWYADFDG